MATIKTRKTNAAPLTRLGEGAHEDFLRTDPEQFSPSGIKTLDDLILGAISSELLLIAAEPSQGKTALAMQWAMVESQNGGSAAVLSMEMGRRALRNRLISGISGVPMRMLRTREWGSTKHQQAALEAAEYLRDIPLFVDDRSGLDGQKVYDAIMSWKAAGVTLGVIDYIQLMGGANDSRVTQVGDAVRAIKEGAKDADLPIIALSSLNRGQGGMDAKPTLKRLRDSGDLEFVADTVLMFHYPEDDLYEDIRVCDIHVLKQRNGPTGVASVQFNKPATRFEELPHG